MGKVERIDDWLAAVEKPSLVPMESIPVQERDAIVLCAGFEDRALEVLKRILSSGMALPRAIVIDYLPLTAGNRADEARKLCAENNIRTDFLTYDRQDPAGIGSSLLNLINETCGNVFLDVSGMSRLLIVQTIVALGRSRHRFDRLVILYAEAEGYPPTREVVKAALQNDVGDTTYRGIFCSSGVFEVTAVPELSSVALQGQPTRLVAFPSFNVDQLVALRSDLQPSFVTLIHGKPPRTENAWRQEAIKRLNRTDDIPMREDIEASTLDYRDTLGILLNVYAKYGALQRIILAPTGSKMQAVAVGVFRTFMDDVQITYPTPRTFAPSADYTKGVRNVYSLSLAPFSPLLPLENLGAVPG